MINMTLGVFFAAPFGMAMACAACPPGPQRRRHVRFFGIAMALAGLASLALLLG